MFAIASIFIISLLFFPDVFTITTHPCWRLEERPWRTSACKPCWKPTIFLLIPRHIFFRNFWPRAICFRHFGWSFKTNLMSKCTYHFLNHNPYLWLTGPKQYFYNLTFLSTGNHNLIFSEIPFIFLLIFHRKSSVEQFGACEVHLPAVTASTPILPISHTNRHTKNFAKGCRFSVLRKSLILAWTPDKGAFSIGRRAWCRR